jgi:hypothetical protein
MAADMLGVRMAHLEGAYEQIDKRLGSLEVRFGSLEGEVRALRHDLHDQFRWTVGLLILAIFAPIVLRLIGH